MRCAHTTRMYARLQGIKIMITKLWKCAVLWSFEGKPWIVLEAFTVVNSIHMYTKSAHSLAPAVLKNSLEKQLAHSGHRVSHEKRAHVHNHHIEMYLNWLQNY